MTSGKGMTYQESQGDKRCLEYVTLTTSLSICGLGMTNPGPDRAQGVGDQPRRRRPGQGEASFTSTSHDLPVPPHRCSCIGLVRCYSTAGGWTAGAFTPERTKHLGAPDHTASGDTFLLGWGPHERGETRSRCFGPWHCASSMEGVSYPQGLPSPS